MTFECRQYCGACCIAPSIMTSIPGMPAGKPAGVRCIHLNKDYRCDLFGKPERPLLCENFQAEADLCGANREQALALIHLLEQATVS
ncbi:YkgJ family cysteine cluster protein [uncultured Oceanicoccus sp.]|uniref:YkgJ family cysteine cluster protein n=1 Tax=uncultured Oceanicoccus sp. TaxID=1706381 RepID=UPI0030D947D0